jgi:hypothetical protein
MELSDFVIGETFWVDGELRISKRIDDDPSLLNGPPYAVEELVFEETSTSMNGRRDRQVGRDLEHYGIRSPGAA